jgi:F0F1-type ATP synthase assembly protein I
MASDAAPAARDNRLRGLGSRAFRLSKPADHQHLYNGFSNALATAVEMVLTPLVFFGAGWWLDGLIGTRPIIAVVLGAVAFAGVVVKMYYAYKAEFARQEEGKPWTR